MTPPVYASTCVYLYLCIPVYKSSKQRMHLTQTVLERETLELSWRDLNL